MVCSSAYIRVRNYRPRVANRHWARSFPAYSILTPENGEDGLDETFYGFCQFPVGSVMMGFLPSAVPWRARPGLSGADPHRTTLAPVCKSRKDDYMARRGLGRTLQTLQMTAP